MVGRNELSTGYELLLNGFCPAPRAFNLASDVFTRKSTLAGCSFPSFYTMKGKSLG
jgi:hypothetical protein